MILQLHFCTVCYCIEIQDQKVYLKDLYQSLGHLTYVSFLAKLDPVSKKDIGLISSRRGKLTHKVSRIQRPNFADYSLTSCNKRN